VRLSAVNCAKTAKPIEMPFWMWTPVGSMYSIGFALAPPGEKD